MLAIFGKV